MFVDEKKAGEVSKTLEPWRELLLEAANVLERHGWCQDVEVNERGEYCILGALGRATCDLHHEKRTWDIHPKNLKPNYQAHIALAEEVGDVPTWNDKPGRTREQACLLLRYVASQP